MKKLMLMISLVVLFVNLGIAQNKHSIQKMTFYLPNNAVKITSTTFDSNSIGYRLTNLKNIYKINDIYLGIKDLEIGDIPIGILDTIKKVHEGLAEDLADIQQTTSEIKTINSNKVFIFYNKLGNSQGYYFVVLKSDNEQLFGGRLVFEGQSNYAAATTILFELLNSVTFPYLNTPQTGTFTKNDCGAGNDTFGRDESYTVAAGTCTSAISQADADSQAQALLQIEGQKNANEMGYCTYYNVAKTGEFAKTTCPKGMYGTSHKYTIPAGIYFSDIEQATADYQAQEALNREGQNNANSVGTCFYKSNEKSGNYTKKDCASGGVGTSVSYRVLFGKYTSTLSQADADAKAQADVNANGQANANAKGYCIFKSKALTNVSFRKNNCAPKVGSIVYYSAAAGAFTSYTSQADADAKAQGAGQANANLKGTCN
jgi:Family of unknown function (DUF5977)